MGSRLLIDSLGKAEIENPILFSGKNRCVTERILYNPTLAGLSSLKDGEEPESFEIASPSEKIYFAPARTKAAIVTCGGLCPGINSVIRALVMQLWYRYEVRNIVGIRYGYQGFKLDSEVPMITLDPEKVGDIHEQGGSILGSSRGSPSSAEIVDSLVRANINQLYVIGGDGTIRGANGIYKEVTKRGLKISVVGVPKTIDNDIPYVFRSFGFETAVAIATKAAYSGHIEAKGIAKGIGLVKLMGRNSGYIAANTALALGHVNFCLIPEVDFSLEGEGGLLSLLEKRFEKSDHTLIVVAEGAGQKYFDEKELDYDASGNRKLGDIGTLLKKRIQSHLRDKGIPSAVKYIDPSYLIRSAPANPADNLLCANLAQNAVHGAMAGKTGMLVGLWHGELTFVPFSALEGKEQRIQPEGDLWFKVLEMTGQPSNIG